MPIVAARTATFHCHRAARGDFFGRVPIRSNPGSESLPDGTGPSPFRNASARWQRDEVAHMRALVEAGFRQFTTLVEFDTWSLTAVSA